MSVGPSQVSVVSFDSLTRLVEVAVLEEVEVEHVEELEVVHHMADALAYSVAVDQEVEVGSQDIADAVVELVEEMGGDVAEAV